MISYPTTQAVLAKHGNTLAGRRAARDEQAAAIRAHAEAQISRAGRSLNCQEGNHSRMVAFGRQQRRVGCGNTGATCICECHDPSDDLRELADQLDTQETP